MIHNDEASGSQRILTLANAITLARLFLVPFAFYFLVGPENNVVAFVLFAIAAVTDFLDGQIARRTNTVTEFGKAIDPLVDRLLIACGVIGLFVVGRLPLWMLVFLLLRDVFLLTSLFFVGRKHMPEIKIRFIGKVTTTALMLGFGGLILNVHKVDGLGWTRSSAFPGFSAGSYSLWMWFVYIGIICSFATMVAYVFDGFRFVKSLREGDVTG